MHCACVLGYWMSPLLQVDCNSDGLGQLICNNINLNCNCLANNFDYDYCMELMVNWAGREKSRENSLHDLLPVPLICDSSKWIWSRKNSREIAIILCMVWWIRGLHIWKHYYVVRWNLMREKNSRLHDSVWFERCVWTFATLADTTDNNK